MASSRAVNAATASCYHINTALTLIAGSKRRSLLMTGDDDEMLMTRSLNLTPKSTEQHLIVGSDKSVAYVTICARRFVQLKLTTDERKHRAASLRQQSYLMFLLVSMK